jgi:hypothetical protein
MLDLELFAPNSCTGRPVAVAAMGPTQCHPRPTAVSHTLARRTDHAARVISGGGCSVHARRKLGKNAVHLGARFLLDLRSCTRGGARSLAVSWPQLVRPIQTHSSRMVL